MWGLQEINWGGDPCRDATIQICLDVTSKERGEPWNIKAQDDRSIVERTPSVLWRAFK
jgi:hypothetical protein